MRSDPVVSLIVGMVLILLILLPRWLWRHGHTAPTVPTRTRATREAKPFAGYTHKPECQLCDHGQADLEKSRFFTRTAALHDRMETTCVFLDLDSC